MWLITVIPRYLRVRFTTSTKYKRTFVNISKYIDEYWEWDKERKEEEKEEINIVIDEQEDIVEYIDKLIDEAKEQKIEKEK